ncbi:hypothetical protein Cgig2_012036 [Carnegiea gigantea]|uniref:Uncharacterized protein n=1 Tax=Carnegiea gigantea TaxID=171969 RepID=A0A9Q1QNF1_9CARY|nr:hypothetical protein Cgig2_012036 [Carnegiea gigantea]
MGHCRGGFLDGTTGLSQGHEYTTNGVVRRHQAPMVVLGMPISPDVVQQRPIPMVACPIGSRGKAGLKGCIAWDGGCKTAVTRWWLFLVVGVSRDTPVHRASSRNSSAAPGKGVGSRGLQEMRPLVKRHAPSRVCERRPSPLSPINRRMALVFCGSVCSACIV